METIIMNSLGAQMEPGAVAEALGEGASTEVLYLCHRAEKGREPHSASLCRVPYEALPCQGLHLGRWQAHTLGALKLSLDGKCSRRWILVEPGYLQALRIIRWSTHQQIRLSVVSGTTRPGLRRLIAVARYMGARVDYRKYHPWRDRTLL